MMFSNQDRTIVVGYGKTEDIVYNNAMDNNTTNHIIAFYGRASDDMVYQLGVTTIMMSED